MQKDTITIYWSTPAFIPKEESWNMLYREPEPVFKDILGKRIKNVDSKNSIHACPASNNFFKNLYVIKSNIDDFCTWPEGYLKSISQRMDMESLSSINLDYFENKILLWSPRTSAMQDYADISYNLSWIFFAEEPLLCRFTAPYYPAHTPSENAILAGGEFDIGQWFRPFNLNYYIPYTNTKFEINYEDPLFYMQILTDKKVEFKRFNFNNELRNLSNEFRNPSGVYGKFMPLQKRYEMAKKSKILDIVLKEIKNNLVD